MEINSMEIFIKPQNFCRGGYYVKHYMDYKLCQDMVYN